MVSIILPCYNAVKYLADSIGSILAQTYTNWELLIINDGSFDDSEKIILGYRDSRIKYFLKMFSYVLPFQGKFVSNQVNMLKLFSFSFNDVDL